MTETATKVILISGKQGSGKTTLQNKIMDKYPGVLLVNFADVLYEMHYACLNIIEKYDARFGLRQRQIVKDGPLLQILGTEWGRKTLGENVWVEILQTRVRNMAPGSVVIIGDCRFENELKAFPNALTVRLECPREIRRARCSMWRDNESHPSETGLDHMVSEFNLVFPTDIVEPSVAADLIIQQLTEGEEHDSDS